MAMTRIEIRPLLTSHNALDGRMKWRVSALAAKRFGHSPCRGEGGFEGLTERLASGANLAMRHFARGMQQAVKMLDEDPTASAAIADPLEQKMIEHTEKPRLLRLYNSLALDDRVDVATVSVRIWQLDPGAVGERPVPNNEYCSADKTMGTFTRGLLHATMIFRDHPNECRRLDREMIDQMTTHEPQVQPFTP